MGGEDGCGRLEDRSDEDCVQAALQEDIEASDGDMEGLQPCGCSSGATGAPHFHVAGLTGKARAVLGMEGVACKAAHGARGGRLQGLEDSVGGTDA